MQGAATPGEWLRAGLFGGFAMAKLTTSLLCLTCGLASPCLAQVLFDNGGVVTTPTGACIPAGSANSQLQTVSGVPNGYFGFGHMLTGGNDLRIADDFTITAPAGWTITTIDVLDYQTNAPTTASPITGMNVRIWQGQPGAAGSVVVFGDTTTNRLTTSVFSGTYRVGNTCDLKRGLFASTLSINASLPPGTYWLDWQAIGNGNYTGPWSPVVTITGLRSKPGANAIQWNPATQTWIPVVDNGLSPDYTSPEAPQDFPFVIKGTINSTCYANCDASTSSPILTANDFQCFLNNYASGLPSANCDASTSTPILTANDFQCFLNAYAAGCS